MLPHVIPLQSASNLRDLGGWPTADGRAVRTGLVFRAPALRGLNPEDAAAIQALGLRTVCDFRGAREHQRRPVEIAGAASHSLPIEPLIGAGLGDIAHTAEVAGHDRAADMLAALSRAYTAYALDYAGQYRALFDHMLRDDGLPLLMHCTAGKDRTGFGAALVLTALGVGWDHVMQDYLATNLLWKRESASDFVMPESAKDVLLTAHAALLTTAFDSIRAAHGSLDAYLAGPLGLDASARARLVDRLVA
jgi:protein-tyrosine phosphatase